MNNSMLAKKMKMFPKADLHRHLEGSITPRTLLTAATRYGGKLPTYELDRLIELVQADKEPPGFTHFLSKFEIFRGFYPGRKAIEYIAHTAVAEAAEDNVKYLELRYSPTHFACSGRFDERDVIMWITGALRRASEERGIVVVPVLTISRDYGVGLAQKTVDLVLDMPNGFFYGLDIAGNELCNSAGPFADLFSMVKARGLGLTIHAGEAGGAENVREAVIDFNADRIGHGIRAGDDASVMGLLRDNDVLLEVCLTSNLQTGVVPCVGEHPLPRLIEHGVPVSLNTDDPAISAISLTDEYVSAVTGLKLTEIDLRALNLAALDHAFYPDRRELKKRLRRYWE